MNSENDIEVRIRALVQAYLADAQEQGAQGEGDGIAAIGLVRRPGQIGGGATGFGE